MRMDSLTVVDLMTTAVVTVRPNDTVGDADLEMRVVGIRHLPVVDENNRVVGIISNRDLYKAMAQNKKPIAIHKIMTKAVKTATLSMPAHEAADLMIQHKIGALPVVGDGGQLVGVVTETDFLSVAYHALLGDRQEGYAIGVEV